MNAHDAIVQATLNILLAAPALADGNVWEEELRALPEGTFEAIVVRLENSRPGEPATLCNPVDWFTLLTLECYARRDKRAPLVGKASRRLHAQAFERLMADRTLGGLLLNLNEPELDFGSAQLNTDLGCCTGAYRAQHRTPFGSLQAA